MRSGRWKRNREQFLLTSAGDRGHGDNGGCGGWTQLPRVRSLALPQSSDSCGSAVGGLQHLPDS